MIETVFSYKQIPWLKMHYQLKYSKYCFLHLVLGANDYILWLNHLNKDPRRTMFFFSLLNPTNTPKNNWRQIKNIYLWYFRLQYLKSKKALI